LNWIKKKKVRDFAICSTNRTFLKVYLYLKNAGINDPEETEKYDSNVVKYGQHFTVATKHLTCAVVKYKNPEEGWSVGSINHSKIT
jgi:hypothetical protein